MNRQAKLKSDSLTDRDWLSFVAMTFSDAAVAYVQREMSVLTSAAIIQVRDESQPNVVHEFSVRREVKYVAKQSAKPQG